MHVRTYLDVPFVIVKFIVFHWNGHIQVMLLCLIHFLYSHYVSESQGKYSTVGIAFEWETLTHKALPTCINVMHCFTCNQTINEAEHMDKFHM
jgi:hypothetical protein